MDPRLVRFEARQFKTKRVGRKSELTKLAKMNKPVPAIPGLARGICLLSFTRLRENVKKSPNGFLVKIKQEVNRITVSTRKLTSQPLKANPDFQMHSAL